jgi:hypothetical protein
LTDSQSIWSIDNIRITKKPEERRKELINISEKLFIKKGYENTSVSEIVAKAKVAQGTFYYYFKTKEEILDSIIEKYISQTVEGMENLANQGGKNAIEKLVDIFLFSSSFRSNRKSILKYLHEEKNAHLHLKFERKTPNKTSIPLSKIISQGVNEGLFDTKYPVDAAKAFIGVSAMVLQDIYNYEPGSEIYKEKLMATIDFLERILGIESGLLLKAFKIKR